jgi:hypothetical protein
VRKKNGTLSKIQSDENLTLSFLTDDLTGLSITAQSLTAIGSNPLLLLVFVTVNLDKCTT